MKNPLCRQACRTDFLGVATKADGGSLPVVRLTQCQPPAPRRAVRPGPFGLPKPCMRLFRKPDPLPSVCHLFAHFFDVTRRWSAGRSIMIGLVRAAALCATLALGLTAQVPRTRPSNATISRIRRSSWRPRSRARRGRSPSPPRRCAPMPTPPSGVPISGRPADPRADRGHQPGRQRQLAEARQDHLPDPLRQFQRTDFSARARLDGGLHRLPARRQSGRGGRCAGGDRPGDVRPQAVASGAG